MAPTIERDWHLKEWLAHFGKRQSSLVNELGWDKAKANFLFHGKQPYRRDIVNEVSQWLGVEPYELLMPPDRALALRRLKETAQLIVAEDTAKFDNSRNLTDNTSTQPKRTSTRRAR